MSGKDKNIKDFPKKVIDENGRTYRLEKRIGEGGQGAVFLAKEKGIAIKLVRSSPGGKFEFSNKSQIEKENGSFKRIKNISLDDIEIKYPIAVLEAPYIGYVMEILDDMIPLVDLMFNNNDVLIPKDEETNKKYIESGGLRRRLKILARIAETMSQLHSEGLVFADPSPNNFFISSDINKDDISLIDADNLEYQSRSNKQIIYTPPFGAPELVAPELVKGTHGVNTLTDAHAFAVIAFWMLTGVHPRYGDIVTDGEPELEEKAQRGELPWIDDLNDNSNSTENGIPRDIIFNYKLKELFQQTFGPGTDDYLKRPGLVEWEYALNESLNSLIHCCNPDCSFHYFAHNDRCPICQETRPEFILVNIKSWLPKKDEIEWEGGLSDKKNNILSLVLTENEPVILNARIIFGDQGPLAYEKKLELEYNSNSNEIFVKNYDRGKYFLASETMDKKVVIKRENKFIIPSVMEELMIHFDNNDQYHRVATFSKV